MNKHWSPYEKYRQVRKEAKATGGLLVLLILFWCFAGFGLSGVDVEMFGLPLWAVRLLPEIEFLFTMLFYVNTLFSAMPAESNVPDCYTFTKRLGEEMKSTFPAFEANPYYRERVNAEEKKLIAMQMRSHVKFYAYYRLLWTYRRLRYGQ